MARYFTIDEAERLIPELDRILDEVIQVKRRHEEAELDLSRFTNRIQMMGGSIVHPGDILQIRTRRDGAARELAARIEELQAYGCTLKDVNLGLVDFPTLYRDEEVFLCWRKGESQIDHWHGIREGYRGRKPIDEDFRANHRGGVQ